MIYLITRVYKIRAKNKDEATKWLNEAVADGREYIYVIRETIQTDTRKQRLWLLELAQEFVRQLSLLVRGTKRR